MQDACQLCVSKSVPSCAGARRRGFRKSLLSIQFNQYYIAQKQYSISLFFYCFDTVSHFIVKKDTLCPTSGNSVSSVSDHFGHEIVLIRGQRQVEFLREELRRLLQLLDLPAVELSRIPAIVQRLAHDAALERTAAVDEQADAQGISQWLRAPRFESLVKLHQKRQDLLGIEVRQELLE